jgi:hypothetical protein
VTGTRSYTTSTLLLLVGSIMNNQQDSSPVSRQASGVSSRPGPLGERRSCSCICMQLTNQLTILAVRSSGRCGSQQQDGPCRATERRASIDWAGRPPPPSPLGTSPHATRRADRPERARAQAHTHTGAPTHSQGFSHRTATAPAAAAAAPAKATLPVPCCLPGSTATPMGCRCSSD